MSYILYAVYTILWFIPPTAITAVGAIYKIWTGTNAFVMFVTVQCAQLLLVVVIGGIYTMIKNIVKPAKEYTFL